MKKTIAIIVGAALIAAIATQTYATYSDLGFAANEVVLLALVFLACLGTALLASRLAVRHAEKADEPATPSTSTREAKQAVSPVRDRRTGPPASAKREQGTVKWFDRNKGYGFIIRRDGEEIFVHHRSVRRVGRGRPGLSDGQTVSFVPVERKRGWQAEDVAPDETNAPATDQ